MKHTTLLLLSSLACFSPVWAAEPPANEQPAATCPDQGGIASALGVINNDISYALLSAVTGETNVTSTHLAEVEKQLDLLIAGNPVVGASDQIKMVRLDYMRGKAAYTLLLPLSREGELPDLRALSGMAAKDSAVITMHMRVDGSKMKTLIGQAWERMDQKDTAGLIALLQDMQAMTASTVISAKPNYLAQIYDNMVLTDSLLKEGLANYAALSLKHVQDNLKDYGSTIHDPKHSAELKQLKLSIDTLSDQLKQQNPSMLGKAKEQFQGWIKSVKSWQTKNPE